MSLQVCVRQCGQSKGFLCLFEPVLNRLHKMGVTTSDALIDVQGVIPLPAKNQGTEPDGKGQCSWLL